MEHIQSHPQLVQVYQPTNSKLHNPQMIHIPHPSLQAHGKVTYQQTITSDIHIPLTSIESDVISQNQIVMSCQQTHFQSIQPLQDQVIQGADLTQQFQITSHVFLPTIPVFKQQISMNEVQQLYVCEYEREDQCIMTKVESQPIILHDKTYKCEPESQLDADTDKTEPIQKKRTRNPSAKPSTWASNIRKIKHQRGEAYTSRRGKYVPERQIKNTNICPQTCKYECNKLISDADREMIFKSFYSLSSNEKRFFILNSTERHKVKQGKTDTKRKHTFKYSFVVRSERYTVCKNFYLGTLAISQKSVYNVHNLKSETNIPKPDGRGLSEKSTNALNEVKERVRKHIQSFLTTDSKPVMQFSKQKQYLSQSDSTLKLMYSMYLVQCSKESVKPVSKSVYWKILKNEVQELYVCKYEKDQCIMTKVESQPIIIHNKTYKCEPESHLDADTDKSVDDSDNDDTDKTEPIQKKRTRNPSAKPSTWASSIRKIKHQRGEAYTSRRGKYVPERQIKNTKKCPQKCKYECNKLISDADREMIFKSFYSLSSNEKRFFILNSTERHKVKQSKTVTKRKHTFKYSFVVRSVRYTVCKNFYLGTLAISQKPVYNVHNLKSETNIPKPDGRGLSENSTNALPNEVKERVREHIKSFPTTDSKPVMQFSKQKQYLSQPDLTLKLMYSMYLVQCSKESVKPVSKTVYWKILRHEFNLHFLQFNQCSACKKVIMKE